jgi:hypothetical protein
MLVQLRGGNGAIEPGEGALDRRGPLDALLDQFLDLRLAQANQGEFGGDEQAIDDDEDGHGQEARHNADPRAVHVQGEIDGEHDRAGSE